LTQTALKIERTEAANEKAPLAGAEIQPAAHAICDRNDNEASRKIILPEEVCCAPHFLAD
jgi:hypothetical protein